MLVFEVLRTQQDTVSALKTLAISSLDCIRSEQTPALLAA